MAGSVFCDGGLRPAVSIELSYPAIPTSSGINVNAPHLSQNYMSAALPSSQISSQNFNDTGHPAPFPWAPTVPEHHFMPWTGFDNPGYAQMTGNFSSSIQLDFGLPPPNAPFPVAAGMQFDFPAVPHAANGSYSQNPAYGMNSGPFGPNINGKTALSSPVHSK
jgi:hypothetical protein